MLLILATLEGYRSKNRHLEDYLGVVNWLRDIKHETHGQDANKA